RREELRPRVPHPRPRLVGREPVTVRQDGGARRAGVIALVVGGERRGERDVLFEIGVALTIRRRRAEQARVHGERLGGVDGGPRAIVALRLLPAAEAAS